MRLDDDDDAVAIVVASRDAREGEVYECCDN